MPVRIQRKRTKGWRLPDGAVIVDRTTRFGNPFTVAAFTKAGFKDPLRSCIEAYTEWIDGCDCCPDVYEFGRRRFDRRWVLDNLDRLAGRDLACWCGLPALGAPDLCHGAVLLGKAARLHASRPAGPRPQRAGYAPADNPQPWRESVTVPTVGELL